MTLFADRAEAGERLAAALARYAEPEVVILGIPRGGVIVGEAVALALGVPLDVIVARKIGAPGNPELGIGAVVQGTAVYDPGVVGVRRIPADYLEREIAAQFREIERRQQVYRSGRPPLDVRGKSAVIVDDGIATGVTALAALRWARANGAARVVLAVPVAPLPSLARLRRDADRIVVLATPEPFLAVGEWYRRFDQTTDEEVVAALARAHGDAA